MFFATCRNLSFKSVNVGDPGFSSLAISSVGLNLTRVSRAVICSPLWGAPKKMMSGTGRPELWA